MIDDSVTVPDVTGKSEEEAERILIKKSTVLSYTYHLYVNFETIEEIPT
jgi:hypothetical protein